MTNTNQPQKINTAYDIIAHILGLKKSTIKENIYFERYDRKRFIRTKCGFEPVEKFNLKVQVLRLEKHIQKMYEQVEALEHGHDQLLRKKEGLYKQLNKSYDYAKGLKKERGLLKRLLKEVLDKNTSWEKRLKRAEKNEENIQNQLEKLKNAKNSLLEQNYQLIEKNKQQKKQILALQNAINMKKEKQQITT